MYSLYQIVNLVSNKKYIGYTEKPLEVRFQQHLNLAKSGKGYWLHAAIRKYGSYFFKIELIKVYSSIKAIREQEKVLIKEQGDYNIHVGGLGGNTLSSHPNISEIRKIMSEAHLKNQKRGKDHPLYIEIPKEVRKLVIDEYYSFELPSPLVLVSKYKLNNKDLLNKIFKESGNKLYRSKIKRFKSKKRNVDTLIKYYVEDGLKVDEIAEKTTLHQDSIAKILREELKIPKGKKLHQKKL